MKIFMVLLLGIVAHTLASQPRPNIKVPPEMERLDFLIGSWNVHSKTLNKNGEIVYESDFSMTFSKEFGGMLIIALSGRRDSLGIFQIGQRTWYFYDTQNKKYSDVNFDIVGNFEIKVGTFVDEKLELAYPESKLARDGVFRIWKKIMLDIEKDSFVWIWYYSEDEGDTWIKHWHTTFKRSF